MRLLNYLTEKKQSRTKEVDISFAKNFIKKNPKSWKNRKTIFRGIRLDVRYGYVEPAKFTRVSANTKNYYTLIIDNSEYWSEYPKRSKSIICSTDIGYPQDFGYLYTVLFKDDAKIGVCPSDDIWGSFKDYLGADLSAFMDWIHQLFAKKECKYRKPETISQLKANFKALNKMLLTEKDPKKYLSGNFNIIDEKWVSNFIEEWQERRKWRGDGKVSLFDIIEDWMKPKSNGFKLVGVNKKINGEYEVWSDSPALLIQMREIDMDWEPEELL